MGKLDVDRLKKKLDRLQGNKEFTRAFWKPSEGRNVIRIVPWKEEPSWPFIEAYFHYLGGKTQLSPITHGNPDPIQEFADDLRGDGSQENWEKARPFFPKARTYVAMIDRAEPEAGVRFYSFGKTVLKKLLSFMDDPDYGDITDVEEGFDIVVNYTPREKSDTNFPKTDVYPRRDPSPLHEDQEQVEEWLTDQPDIWDLIDEPTYDELVSFLETFLGADPEEEEMTSITERVTNGGSSDDEEDDDSDEEELVTSNAKNEFDELFENS